MIQEMIVFKSIWLQNKEKIKKIQHAKYWWTTISGARPSGY